MSGRTGTAVASIPVPEGWEVLEQTEHRVIVAAPTGSPAFRANAVLTTVPSPAPITDASSAALANAVGEHPGALLVSCDVWPSGAHPGRSLLFTYPVGEESEVAVQQYVWATGRHHVHLVASCATYQLEGHEPFFLDLAAGTTFAEDA